MYDKLRLRKYCRYIVYKIDKVDGVETIVLEREVSGFDRESCAGSQRGDVGTDDRLPPRVRAQIHRLRLRIH